MKTLAALGGWSALLGELTAGHDLPAATSDAAMTEILSGNASPAQIAAFIVALRMKGESVDELIGMLSAMRRAGDNVPVDATALALIDTCGTGGDRSHSINVSTIAALVVAGAGGKVCKHGNRSASSKCGSADVLEELGVVIDLGPEGVARCIKEAGMGFCFAPKFHPAMRHAGPTRRELGVPTVFNFLGPMANPGNVGRQIVGVSDPAMAERMIRVLEGSGAVRAMIVHGDDGLDELSVTATSTVHELRDGRVTTHRVDPEELGFERADAADLRGGDASENAEAARQILAGQTGARRDIVVLNAAGALIVAGVVDDLAAGVSLAEAVIDDGRASAALDALIAVSLAAAAS